MITRGSSWSRPALVMTIYLGLAAAALVWAGLRGEPNLWRVSGHDDPHPITGVLLGLAFGLAVVFVSQLSVHKFEWARALHREFRSMLGPLPDAEVVVIALASSLGEEMFFRGVLMPVAGLWLQALLFALLHIGPKLRYLPWTISSLVAGLVFGELTNWSGDLSGAVVAHFTVNFLNLRHVSRYDLR